MALQQYVQLPQSLGIASGVFVIVLGFDKR
jgi:hypothetical protein